MADPTAFKAPPIWANTVSTLIGRVLSVKTFEQAPLAEALETPIRRVSISDPMEYYEGEFVDRDDLPFDKIDLRINKQKGNGILVLKPKKGIVVREDELSMPFISREPPLLDTNLHIPPEGTRTIIYRTPEADTHVQFTGRSKQLRSLSVQWKGKPAGTV